jgi:hypothetical protein
MRSGYMLSSFIQDQFSSAESFDVRIFEVFTLPQVFLVDPHGMAQNPCRSMQIPSREWNSLSVVFWPLQSTWIHMDPHGL